MSQMTASSGAKTVAGRLEDIPLAGLLHMLSEKRITGKLTLKFSGGDGLVVVRNGSVIYAASNSARETLGNILVCRGLLDEKTLLRALEVQHELADEKRLGAILVELGAISQASLEDVLRQQTAKVVRELLGWEQGFFRFEPMDIVEGGEIRVDVRDLVMDAGLDATSLTQESLESLETEEPKEKPGRQKGRSGRKPAKRAQGDTGIASLKSVLAELRSPAFTGEFTLWILRYASRIVRRCVFFSYSKEAGIRGMAQLGLDEEANASGEGVGLISIPADEPSIFSGVIQTGQSYKGELPRGTWNEYLAIQLGGMQPPEVVVVPMVVNGNVIALLYCDNLPSRDPIGPIEGLEVLLMEAGLAMEKTTLEIRLKTLQSRLGVG